MSTLTPFLRKVVLADAITGAGAGIALVAGADLTHAMFGLPSALLFWSGVALIPFLAMLVSILRTNSTALLPVIVALNFAWVAASLYVAFGPSFAPTVLGQAFVCVQGQWCSCLQSCRSLACAAATGMAPLRPELSRSSPSLLPGLIQVGDFFARRMSELERATTSLYQGNG